MKIIIVGGNFSDTQPKESGVIRKLNEAFALNAGPGTIYTECINGGKLSELPKVLSGDVNIWMPNIDNSEDKQYPMKYKGAILICSKVMSPGYTMVDAVSRIFKMHGNAVIAISKDESRSVYIMELIDALGNTWYKGDNIYSLATAIMAFTAFTKDAKRIQTQGINNVNTNVWYKKEFQDRYEDLTKFIELNKALQNSIMQKCGNRFFGNLSTRCSKLFPTMRIEKSCIFVSPRNIDKNSIIPEDMVLYMPDDTYLDNAGRKPSVDSPAQMRLYQNFRNINYMIHGHAFILTDDFLTTENYKLCGDVKEVDEIVDIVSDPDVHELKINLKNHGFLIGTHTLTQLKRIIDNISTEYEVIMR